MPACQSSLELVLYVAALLFLLTLLFARSLALFSLLRRAVCMATEYGYSTRELGLSIGVHLIFGGVSAFFRSTPRVHLIKYKFSEMSVVRALRHVRTSDKSHIDHFVRCTHARTSDVCAPKPCVHLNFTQRLYYRKIETHYLTLLLYSTCLRSANSGGFHRKKLTTSSNFFCNSFSDV